MLIRNTITNVQSFQIKQRGLLFTLITVAAVVLLSASGLMRAQAATEAVAYSNGFETNTAGWAGSGTITRVASGNDGIVSAQGGSHAIVTGTPGPNTQLGGYSNTWSGDWTTSTDVYLDPSWAPGTGFLYSVASNNTSGANLRDFIFHAAVVNDESTGNVDRLVVLADTEGTQDGTPTYQFGLLPTERRGEVTSAGWYTIKHTFRNIEGHLVVNVSLLNASKQVVFTYDITRGSATDLIPSVVGGNRYGWFTNINVTGGVAIDNVNRLTTGNAYNISDDATTPVDIAIKNDETITLLNVTNGVVETPVKITATNPSSNISIVIPANTVITAQDSSWSGVLDAPMVTALASATLSGQSVNLDAAIKVGAGTPLSFSQPVKVVIPNQAGKNAGYIDNTGVLHPITTRCASDIAATLVNGTNECYVNENNNLVIWTNHFSTFAAYSTDAASIVPGAPNTGVGPSADLSVQNMLLLLVGAAVAIIASAKLFRHVRTAAIRNK